MGDGSGAGRLEYLSPGELARELGVTPPTARAVIAGSGKGVTGAKCPCCGSSMRGTWIAAEDAADYLAGPGVPERRPVADESCRLYGMVQERIRAREEGR